MRHLTEFGVIMLALFVGLIGGRLLSDMLKKVGVPIATGDIGKTPLGQGTASGIRPAS